MAFVAHDLLLYACKRTDRLARLAPQPLLLNQRLRGESIFRTFYFLPSLTPAAAAAILWVWILHPEAGLVNYLIVAHWHRWPHLVGINQVGSAFDHHDHAVDWDWWRPDDYLLGRPAECAAGTL